MSTCARCKTTFLNRMQLGAHRRHCVNVAGSQDASQEDSQDSEAVFDAIITQPYLPHITLHSLCRRQPGLGNQQDVTLPARPHRQNELVRDYQQVICCCYETHLLDQCFLLQVQQMWEEYVRIAYECCCKDFWTVFECVRRQSTTCRDKILSCVKDLTKFRGQRWPRNCRQLKTRVSCVYCVCYGT